MKKGYFFFFVMVFILLISACSKAEEPQEPTAEPSPNITEIVNAADCTNQAAFLTDVTIPDNTNIDQGKTFNKIWRIENTGTCIWTTDYIMTFVDGEKMNTLNSIPVELTRPNETLDIAIDLVAPKTEGSYRADFELHTPTGETIPIDKDNTLWVIINVGATAGNSGSTTTGTSGTLNSGDCAYTIDQDKVSEVLATINSYRAQSSLPALTTNTLLTEAAQAHSTDMACNSLFYHDGSDGSTPDSRVAAAGYSASGVTENVYGSWPPLNGQDVVSWWVMDQTDPRHNENLLTTKYSEIGIGYSFYDNYGYYVVDFAAP